MADESRQPLSALTRPTVGNDPEAMERVLLDAISDLGQGVVVTEAGRCVWANDAYCQMTGYTRDELFALPSLIELAPVEDREELVQRLRERLAGGHVQDHYEAWLLRKDGELRRVENAVKLVSTDQGPRLVAVIRDVTDRQKLEEFRKYFAMRVSHEFKNVVAPLTGFAEMLSSSMDQLEPATRDAMLAGLQRQGKKLADLMDRMLDLAKFEQGEFNLQPQRVHVRDVAQTVIDIQRTSTDKSITNTLSEDLIAWVDPVRLDQILTNLLSNAIKYGGTEILVEGERADEVVLLTVADDGPPLPPDESTRLFEAFVRGVSAGAHEGSGLGLAISRGYARASGGELTYEDDPSGGKRFVVRLPAEPPS